MRSQTLREFFAGSRNDRGVAADPGRIMSKNSRSKNLFIMSLASILLGAGLGVISTSSAQAAGGDCIEATCSGVKSCAKLKRACDYGSGTFVAKTRNQDGKVTSGTCSVCY